VKNKILFIGDDIRQTTGVANILKQLVLHLSAEFDIVQIACGSPQSNSIIDVSESVSQITGNKNCNVKLYETNSFCNVDKLRNTLLTESPDCIFIMTDPHRYDWLFEIEQEIRTVCPLMYYHVWDNTPYPKFLKSIYKSCDWIGCISKTTQKCVSEVCADHKNYTYIPHGVNTQIYNKQANNQIEKHRLGFLGKNYEFVLFCNNVNQRRKNIGNLIAGFADFYDKLTSEQQDGVVLLLHTNPDSPTGPNINCILDDLYADLPVLLSTEKVDESILNNMYNLSHCTINVASNEGFGLTTLESVATETPVIMTHTGGLKDQYNELWSEKIIPSIKLLTGSQKTPYIHSDICTPVDISHSIRVMYDKINKKEIEMNSCLDFLNERGFTTTQMCDSISHEIQNTIKTFKPKKQFKFVKVTTE